MIPGRDPSSQPEDRPERRPAGEAAGRPTAGPRDGASRSATIVEIQEARRLIEAQEERIERMRRRRVLIVGVGISMLVHLALTYVLATQYWTRGGSGSGGSAELVGFDVAVMGDDELADLESLELESEGGLASAPIEVEDLAPGEVSVDAVPAAQIGVGGTGALPALGGSGGGGGGGGGDGDGVRGLGGAGGAGTSFFGVGSRGTRFAFVVDRSASMADDRKLVVALRELVRSISSLPDFASFYVVLYSTEPVVAPGQREWTRARPGAVSRLLRWLDTIDPAGGTVPLPAFHEIFALDVRPDVIFFLTDGEIPEDTADGVARLNAQAGSRVVINTIAFGGDAGQEQLRRIAEESGGRYRFVPTGFAP
jgi:hypothetical protein